MNRNTGAILRLVLYFAGVILLGCLMSPWLYHAGTALAAAGVLPIVEGFPFHRYFSRSMQIAAVLLLWPAFRSIGISKMSELNLVPNPRRWRDLGIGFAIALVPVILLGVFYVVFGVFRFQGEPSITKLFRILGTASVVAVVEEFLFRGVVLGLLLRAVPPAAAALISAAVFSGVHFLKVARTADGGAVTWSSGFEQLPNVLSGGPGWPLVGWGFVSLVLAGLVLAQVTLRTRSLFGAIGLHAGWILGQQGIPWLARYAVVPPLAMLPWVGPNVVSGAVPTGLVPLVALMVTGAAAFLVFRDEGTRRH